MRSWNRVFLCLILSFAVCSLRWNQNGIKSGQVVAFNSDEFLDDDEFFVASTPVKADKPSASIPQAAESSQNSNRPAAVQAGAGSLQEKTVVFDLEHNLKNGGRDFKAAGHLSLRLRTTVNGAKKFSKLTLERLELSAEEKAAFQELLEADAFYQVRVPSSVFGASPPRYVMASAKARCLLAAGLKEKIELHMNAAGNVVGVSYIPEADCSKSLPATSPLLEADTWPFTSAVGIKMGSPGPRIVLPVEVPLLPPPEPLKPGEVPPKPMEPKTFWQKYWMYIIPFGVIFLNAFLSSAAEAPPATGAAGGAGGGAIAGRGGGPTAARRR
eukprot:TRINITY_DN32689_c0_g1_i1.p1 TRINITY_DN32689_c0_g1~~TRINITY_DN32689_c0_g1_i1.p1  ORF type:complete len:327 (+),score=61.74 TRINITY_DN32689_c0_g1_i1:214-1194(+)